VQAEQRLGAGDGEGALALLRQAQTEDPSNPRVVTAIAQIQAATGDPEGAEQTLAGLPPGEQDEPDIVRLRAQLFFGRVAAAAGPHEATARRLAASPDDSEAHFQVAAHQVMENALEGAAESLLQLMQRDRKFGDDAARTALLKLFDILGEDPAVTRYRARLFALLH
jgi:putative thioredoxin